jgi:hypothetical protein
MSKIVTIHHFDDEPDTVDWIPDSLFNYYRLTHPSWTALSNFKSPEDEAAEQVSWSFSLSSPQPVIVKYHIYRRPKVFNENFRPESEDIAFLDVITEMDDGTLEPTGLDFYELACKKLSPERVYILSGFPGTIREKLHRLPIDHLIIKPPDASDIISILVERLSYSLGL